MPRMGRAGGCVRTRHGSALPRPRPPRIEGTMAGRMREARALSHAVAGVRTIATAVVTPGSMLWPCAIDAVSRRGIGRKNDVCMVRIPAASPFAACAFSGSRTHARTHATRVTHASRCRRRPSRLWHGARWIDTRPWRCHRARNGVCPASAARRRAMAGGCAVQAAWMWPRRYGRRRGGGRPRYTHSMLYFFSSLPRCRRSVPMSLAAAVTLPAVRCIARLRNSTSKQAMARVLALM